MQIEAAKRVSVLDGGTQNEILETLARSAVSGSRSKRRCCIVTQEFLDFRCTPVAVAIRRGVPGRQDAAEPKRASMMGLNLRAVTAIIFAAVSRVQTRVTRHVL